MSTARAPYPLHLHPASCTFRLPPDCSFELCIYASSREGLDATAWIEEQHLDSKQQQQLQQQPGGGGGGGLELAAAEIVPLKSCTLPGALQLQLYAEV